MTGIAIIQCALHQRLAITTPRGANTDPSGPRLISTTAFPQALAGASTRADNTVSLWSRGTSALFQFLMIGSSFVTLNR